MTGQAEPKFPQIKHHNGLNTDHAYSDSDIGYLSKALRIRDRMQYLKTGNLIETGITRIDNRTIIETPAISGQDQSPISSRIEEQIQHLNTLISEEKISQNCYPITILAPYKLVNRWHWNILEITIEDQDSPANCKQYDTDGCSTGVDTPIFKAISLCLNELNIKREIHFSSIVNQTNSKKEYPHSLQRRVNCGLACSIIMQDLRRGEKNYDNLPGATEISDKYLRNYAYQIVDQYGDNAIKNNFCTPPPRLNQNERRELALVIKNKKNQANEERQLLKVQLDTIEKNENEIAILKLAKQQTNIADTIKELKKLPTNSEVRKLLFREDGAIKDHAIDVVKGFTSQETTTDSDASITKEEEETLMQAISTLKQELKNGDKQMESFINALAESLEKEELSNLFKEMANKVLENHRKKGNQPPNPPEPTEPTEPKPPVTPPSPTPPTEPTEPKPPVTPTEPETPEPPTEPDQPEPPVTPPNPTPPTEPEQPIQQLTQAQQEIINRYSQTQQNQSLAIVPIVQDLSREINEINYKNSDNLAEYLHPKTYSGIGASTHHTYNTEKQQFEFKIGKIFPGGLAESLNLESGFKIIYKSNDNSNDSLREAVKNIRELALLSIKSPPPTQEEQDEITNTIEIINDKGQKTNIIQDIVEQQSQTKKILIHNEQTYDNSTKFLDAIRNTANEIAQQIQRALPAPKPPSPEPKKPTAGRVSPSSEQSASNDFF